jgi:uncharacterized membrane protein
MAAISMTMILAATALSFDIGREVDTNRSVQAVADEVALDAADFIDGTAASAQDYNVAINNNTTYSLAQVIQYEATESALRNGVADGGSDSVIMGTCSSSRQCPTFTQIETCPFSTALASAGAGSCTAVAGADPTTVINAVRVDASSVTSFVFQAGSATSNRTATAMRVFRGSVTTGGGGPPGGSSGQTGVSAFSLGSGLLNFQNPYVDQVLSQELGTSSAAISALSNSGLAGVDVTLGQILAANTQVGTLSNLLNNDMSPGTALSDYYKALVDQDTTAAVAAYGNLSEALGVGPDGATGVGASGGVELCNLVDLSGGTNACNASSSGALAPAAYAEINAATFLTDVAALSDANHAVDVSVGGLGVLEATVTTVSPVAVAGPGPAEPVGQPCPRGLGPCPVRATQTQADATLTLDDLSLGDLGSVNISLQVTGAVANAKLTGLSCGTSESTETATIAGNTEAATVAPSFTIAGNSITGTSVSVGQGSFSNTFDGPFGANEPAAWSTSNSNPNIVLSAPSGLGAVAALLNAALSSLDSALTPILQAQGINLGYATVADNYVNCETTVLVGSR